MYMKNATPTTILWIRLQLPAHGLGVFSRDYGTMLYTIFKLFIMISNKISLRLFWFIDTKLHVDTQCISQSLSLESAVSTYSGS